MNIGLFTDTYFPQINGVATSVLTLKRNLEKAGHSVYVFTTTSSKIVNREKNVFRVPSIPFVSSTRIGSLYNFKLAYKIKKLQLDVIHTHTEFSIGIFGRIMARMLNIPIVHTYHTIYEEYTHYVVKYGLLNSVAKEAARKMSTFACNRANQVIVPTEKVKNLLTLYGVKTNIKVIPTGIQLDKFSKEQFTKEEIDVLRTSLGIRKEDKVMIYVGRIAQEKHIGEIVTGAKEYFARHKNTKLLIVGDGAERAHLEAMAHELGISSQIIFAGEQPWEQIGKFYQLGDVFVSASQSETQGLTYIEAMAAGLPVVAKKDPCLENVLVNGINGFSFTSEEELVRAIEQIFTNNSCKELFSQGALKKAQDFSEVHFANQIENIYYHIVRLENIKVTA